MDANQLCIALATAGMRDDWDLVADLIRAMDENECAATLAAMTVALASAWHVSAVELGMTDDEFIQPLALAVARQAET
jgi:hypothetical protein